MKQLSSRKDEKIPENLKELLFWKKELKKIIDLEGKEDGLSKRTELKKRKMVVSKKLDRAERAMYDIEKGLYFGIGYKLDNDSDPKPTPIIAKWEKLNNHVGFKGTTRVGKTQNMLTHIEQVIAKGWDVIIIDPKGGVNQEVLSSVIESCYRYERAEDLTYFSAAFPEVSQRINVCYGMSNAEISAFIVESLKTPTIEDFYLEVSERIIMAITTGLEYLQELSDPDGSITKLWEKKEIEKYHEFIHNTKIKQDEVTGERFSSKGMDMMEHFKISVEEDRLLETFQESGFNRSLITFRDLEAYCSHDALTSLLNLVEFSEIDEDETYRKDVHAIRRDALAILRSALKTPKEHMAKVSDTLSNRLLQLSVGPIGELLCSIRINPLMNRLLNKERGIVSVIQPFPMKFKRSSMVFTKMLLGMLDSMMGSVGAEGRPLPRKVVLFGDEFGAIAYPGIENFFNRAGGLGVSVFVYTQTDEDYKEAVGETLSHIILDNVNTQGIMRLNSLKSAEEAAKEIGTFKQLKTIAMVDSDGAGGRYTTDTAEEYICDQKDIRSMPVGEGILMHDGFTYYVEFPYRRAPVASVRMPELFTEKDRRELSMYEHRLEELVAQTEGESI